ncbi:MAG: ATP-binding protein [Tabrizicola sp.]|jgi:PAS domain S-box-containing protein|nr:ATP-binding protein [Tabrizicola sp.]
MTLHDKMPKPARRRLRGLPILVLTATLIGILVFSLAITFLANSVQREVDALAVANSDTTQWSLVQTEVELLALQVAIHMSEHQANPDLAEIRRRYDVLYSRIRLIGESKQFTELRQNPEAARSLAVLTDFLDQHTPAIDGPDSALIAHLPALGKAVDALRATGRDFSLLGVRFYAADSDAKRQGVASTLAKVGYLTLALALTLLGGIAILMVMFRRSIRSERLAAEARNRLEEVIATSLDGIIAADADGRIIEYNGAAERVFGYTRAEAVGQDMADLIIPDHLREAHVAGMKRYRATRKRHVLGKGLVRLEARRKDGSVFPVELSLSAAVFGRREIFVSFLRDISDRVAAEQELIKARDQALAGELAKAELLAVMSHEMRTPLNGILGTIELLRDTNPTPRQVRYIAAMNTSAALLLHHVNGVLSMSRAEAGQLDLSPSEVDPASLVQELVESQRHAIEAHGNRIECDTTTAPDRIFVDPLRLRQVILNLVGNANKFTRQGEIRVECDHVPGTRLVEFRVSDTGIGIAEADRDRIFEAFKTLDTSYSRRAEGTGLGLAISRRLVAAMGGEIGVDSELGEGSLFWVRLPIGLTEPQSKRPPAVKRQTLPALHKVPKRPLNVLLVEDNQINRLVARDMLAKAGHKVLEAHDGREGVRLAAMQRFDVILMDISMPELDGVAATRQIRDGDGPNRAAPILALSAHALPEDKQRFLAAGIDDIIVKPLTIAALQQALAQAGRPQDTGAAEGIAARFADLCRQLGRDKAVALLTAFRSEGETLMTRLQAADWLSVPTNEQADAVHKLAGSASVLGAGQLREGLNALETAYRQAHPDPATPRLAEIAAVWEAARQEIDGCLGTQGIVQTNP